MTNSNTYKDIGLTDEQIEKVHKNFQAEIKRGIIEKRDIREGRKQLPCRRCQTKNWYTNLTTNNLFCPFCVDIERINKHFKELQNAEGDLRIKSGKSSSKRTIKRKEMYIDSLDELKNEVDNMSGEEKSVMLRELGFEKY